MTIWRCCSDWFELYLYLQDAPIMSVCPTN